MSDVPGNDDPVLIPLLDEVGRDEETIGVLLGGSRGSGLGHVVEACGGKIERVKAFRFDGISR